MDANRGMVAPLSTGFGDGLSFQDPAGASPDPGATALWVTRNRWKLGSGDEAAASGITANGAARLRLAGNRLSGRAGTGLEVDATNRCRILGNSLQGLDTGAGPDLHLGSGTSDCLAIVAPDDVVVDDGCRQPRDPAIARPPERGVWGVASPPRTEEAGNRRRRRCPSSPRTVPLRVCHPA